MNSTYSVQTSVCELFGTEFTVIFITNEQNFFIGFTLSNNVFKELDMEKVGWKRDLIAFKYIGDYI